MAFRKRHAFDPARASVRPWLFGIATNLVADHRRMEGRRYRALMRAGTEQAEDSHENRVVTWVMAEGFAPRLAKALAGLSRGDRDVVSLLALGQLTHAEVAEALGIPYGTVGSRLSRARKKLRGFTILGARMGVDQWIASGSSDDDVWFSRFAGAIPQTASDQAAWKRAGSPKTWTVLSNGDHTFRRPPGRRRGPGR